MNVEVYNSTTLFKNSSYKAGAIKGTFLKQASYKTGVSRTGYKAHVSKRDHRAAQVSNKTAFQEQVSYKAGAGRVTRHAFLELVTRQTFLEKTTGRLRFQTRQLFKNRFRTRQALEG